MVRYCIHQTNGREAPGLDSSYSELSLIGSYLCDLTRDMCIGYDCGWDKVLMEKECERFSSSGVGELVQGNILPNLGEEDI